MKFLSYNTTSDYIILYQFLSLSLSPSLSLITLNLFHFNTLVTHVSILSSHFVSH